jgi:hypothetical protein
MCQLIQIHLLNAVFLAPAICLGLLLIVFDLDDKMAFTDEKSKALLGSTFLKVIITKQSYCIFERVGFLFLLKPDCCRESPAKCTNEFTSDE